MDNSKTHQSGDRREQIIKKKLYLQREAMPGKIKRIFDRG